MDAYVEVLIKNFETKEYRWLKICGNTAYHNNEGEFTSHFKINGNEFLKLLEKHLQTLNELSQKPYKKGDMCKINYIFGREKFVFNFDYEDKEILNFANILYTDFKKFIDENVINYQKIENQICEEIKGLKEGEEFIFDDYFQKFGIIDKGDKDFLFKQLLDDHNLGKLVKIKKKLFQPIYCGVGIKV